MSGESPEVIRAEIDLTRARMSTTIDEIEDILVEKTDKVRDTLDVPAKVRRDPMKAVGIVVGTGLLLGFLTGSRKNDEDARNAWEKRARRILDIANEQEGEIKELHEALREVEQEASAALDYD